MARNTLIVVIILAILAALVVGVNLTQSNQPANSLPSTPTANPSPTVTYKLYQLHGCGIGLSYPDTLTTLEGPANSVVFSSIANPKSTIIATCQKDIPRPTLSADKTEKLLSGSVSATLYHDVSRKDDTPIDKLIFRHPDNDLDIFVSGYGPDFQAMISNIQLLK